ncbi:MAG: hypothetical protein CTY26_06100 [Methylophilus sp.]|nr:MAG: hypothetical protein CTY26_06100 [Methylophilus sp.]
MSYLAPAPNVAQWAQCQTVFLILSMIRLRFFLRHKQLLMIYTVYQKLLNKQRDLNIQLHTFLHK